MSLLINFRNIQIIKMDSDSDVIGCGVDVHDASKKTYMNTYHPYLYDSEQVLDMITIPFKLEKNIYKPLIKPIREIVKTVSRGAFRVQKINKHTWCLIFYL